jgi:magnesium chelatase family protein
LRRRYLARLSGPLVDRLDIHILVPPVEVEALTRGAPGESSAAVRERVLRARKLQLDRRRAGITSARNNAALPAADLVRVANPDAQAKATLEKAMTSLALSARAYVRVLRVARTLADLEGEPRVRHHHVFDALKGRLLDREILP